MNGGETTTIRDQDDQSNYFWIDANENPKNESWISMFVPVLYLAFAAMVSIQVGHDVPVYWNEASWGKLLLNLIVIGFIWRMFLSQLRLFPPIKAVAKSLVASRHGLKISFIKHIVPLSKRANMVRDVPWSQVKEIQTRTVTGVEGNSWGIHWVEIHVRGARDIGGTVYLNHNGPERTKESAEFEAEKTYENLITQWNRAARSSATTE